MGRRIPFEEYYAIEDGYRRFDERKTAFSVKRQKIGEDAFSYNPRATIP